MRLIVEDKGHDQSWIHIETPDGCGQLHAVEPEGPRPHLDRAELRLQPYLEAHKSGAPQPLLMVFLTRESEESCMRRFPGIWALTTTIAEALQGPDRGEGSVWRHRDRAVDIHHLLTVEPEDPIPQSGRLQSQGEGRPNRRAMVSWGRKAQVLARKGIDIFSGNHPSRRRKLRLALTRVAKTSPSPGRRNV